MAKIIRLSSSNIKRLEAVEIKPDGSLVVIGGKNGQGKSSAIDSAWYALGGKKGIPPKPVRRGAQQGRVELDLDNGLRIVRTFTKAGGTSLIVTDESGEKQRSPQAILDKLVGRRFDPFEYSRLSKSEQVRILREIIGIDTTDLDNERNSLYIGRHVANREVKRLESLVQTIPWHEDAPEHEVSISDLTDELEKRQGEKRASDESFDKLKEAERTTINRLRQVADEAKSISLLEEQLENAKERLINTKSLLASQQKKTSELAATKVLPESYTDQISEQLRSAESINRKIRENHQCKETCCLLDNSQAEASFLDSQIVKIDESKRRLLDSSEFPLDGLGFDDDGLTLNGVPLEQASSAEQLRLSVAMGLALNPDLRVLFIRDASLLDEDSLRMIAEMAQEGDAQVWIEVISTDSKKCSVIIEDGRIKQE